MNKNFKLRQELKYINKLAFPKASLPNSKLDIFYKKHNKYACLVYLLCFFALLLI